jgi:hypothetical protein
MPVTSVNIRGGIGISYRPDEQPFDLAGFAAVIRGRLDSYRGPRPAETLLHPDGSVELIPAGRDRRRSPRDTGVRAASDRGPAPGKGFMTGTRYWSRAGASNSRPLPATGCSISRLVYRWSRLPRRTGCRRVSRRRAIRWPWAAPNYAGRRPGTCIGASASGYPTPPWRPAPGWHAVPAGH